MNKQQITDQEKNVLRWGGMAGIIGGFVFQRPDEVFVAEQGVLSSITIWMMI
ncbi:MAG TPA: hypothetical protein VLA72_02090 [Anaerolineales bacterium]|nr:hypothetical protein [Anaerolineales bacterium]